MYKIIGIIAALIFGAFAGRIASNIMNKDELTINPIVCTIVGVIGGGLGGWMGGEFTNFFAFGGIETFLVQIGFGIVLATFLQIFLSFVREKKQEPLDSTEEDTPEQS